MRRLLPALLLAAAPAWAAAPDVLSNTNHIAADAANAIAILGGSGVVDQTCASSGSFCGPFIDSQTLIAESTNTGFTFYAHDSTTPANHAPYGIMNQSSTGYTLASVDQRNYAALASSDQLYVMAFCGAPLAGDYPAVRASTILPSDPTLPNTPNGSSGCGYGTGIEFSMTPGYKGFATSTPSGTTEALSGIHSTLRANHPAWTYADVKGALRQTSSNWPGGYAVYHASPLAFGYGNVDFDAATAIASASSIYLQPPGAVFQAFGNYATITLYPFVTTRRAREVVYAGGTWPAASAGNELTAAQIASAGGTKVIDNGGATGVQTYTYAPAASGSVTFTALTLDASGNGSRVESFAQASLSFTVGAACLQ